MPTGRKRSDEIRAPRQERSQKRVDQILRATKKLIAQKGSAGLTIVEIAQVAEVTAGSIYQYFPNKAAIVSALGERYLRQFREELGAAFSDPPASKEQLFDMLSRQLQAYYKIHRDDPVVREIWMGTSVDKSLLDLDAEDTKLNVQLIYDIARPFYSHVPEDKLRMHILLVIEFTAMSTRLAVRMTAVEGEKLMMMAEAAQLQMWETLANTSTDRR